MFALGALVATSAPDVAANANCSAGGHCYSRAADGSDNPYTGVRDTRWVIDLNNTSPSPVYQTMWFNFDLGAPYWLELGTEYKNSTTKHFEFICVPGFCNFQWRITTYTGVGAHTFKIDRNTGDHNSYNFYIDSNLADTKTEPYTSAENVTLGLETYNMSITVEAHAYYNLKYKKGDGSYQDWAGEDWSELDDSLSYPMCGQWHLPTSWWAGEHTSCA